MKFPRPAQPERGSYGEKTGTDFRTEASGLRQDTYDVPNPPSSAVRWAVIRMGIVGRPRKAQATGLVTSALAGWGPIKQVNVYPLSFENEKNKKKET